MARGRPPRSRRPRRRAPLGLQGTLGTLLRTTLDQVGTLRDAALEQARSSRDRLDAMRLDRQRRDALADLGEAVLALWYDSRPAILAKDRDVAALIGEIEALDGRPEIRPRGVGGPDEPRAPQRRRRRDAEPRDDREDDRDDDRAEDYEAVSSSGWRPPRPAAQVRVWRPVPPPDEPLGEPSREPEAPAGARRRVTRSSRGGGIAFVSDEVAEADDDLTAYMHDDDVPGGSEPPAG